MDHKEILNRQMLRRFPLGSTGGAVFLILGLLMSTASCSLAGDVTPPPALATAQMRAPSRQVTATPAHPVSSDQGFEPLALPPSIRPDLLAGEVIYQERCAPCHGQTGLADGEMSDQLEYPPTLLGDPAMARQALPVDWYDAVTQGRLERFMPPFQSLDDESRWDVVAYALTLHTTPDQLSKGETLYGESCASCHGQGGAGGSSGPALTEPDRFAARSLFDDYTVITAGRSQSMPAYGEQYDDQERWALASYVQSLVFRSLRPEEIAGSVDNLSSGLITGSVFNASANGTSPSGMEIMLHGFDGEEQVISEITATDTDGQFSFEDVEVQPGRLFFATLDYQGVGYRSDVLHYLPGEGELDLAITVFESNQDVDALQVDRLHVFFDPSVEGVLQVLELWVISNPTDQVIVPMDGEISLEVPLPAGTENLQFEGDELGERYILTENGFGLRAPVLPGSGVEELVFSFNLPYERSVDFDQQILNPVQAVVLMAPGEGLEIRGEDLEDLGVQTMGTLELRNYRGASLSPGESLQFRIAGPSTDFPLTELAIGLAAFGAALVVAGLWWFRSRGDQPGAPDVHLLEREFPEPSASQERDSEVRVEGTASREELVQAIAALDDDYEAGRVESDEYQARRALLIHQALDTSGGEDD